jgi:hypothetical protein
LAVVQWVQAVAVALQALEEMLLLTTQDQVMVKAALAVQAQQHIFQVHQLLTQVAVAQALFQVKLLEMPVQVVAQRVQV